VTVYLRAAHAAVSAAVSALDAVPGNIPRPAMDHVVDALEALGDASQCLAERISRAEQGGAAGPWYLLEQAVDQWARIAGHPGTDAGFRRAQAELVELAGEVASKGSRETDSAGRQLYRAGRAHGQVRLVVDPREQSRHGELPVLLWVGTSRPPGWCWDGGRREPGAAQGAPADRRRRDRG